MARPREFDIEEALDAVMGVFWRLGFDGTSMQDIEAATGLNKQSLYRIFEDKRSMYLAALARYEAVETEKARAALSGDAPAKAKFEKLYDAALGLAAKGDRSGCFLCNAATDQGQADAETTEFVNAAIKRIEKLFRSALADTASYKNDAKLLEKRAANLLAVYFGLRVMTKAGMPLRVLKAAASAAVESI